jgi:hypothetical protein
MGSSIGNAGLTKKEMEQAVEDAVNSPTSFATIRDANEDAINNAGGGGGGGGELLVPDFVVSGTGPYVVPAGFNAKVKVSCRVGHTFTVNGFTTLSVPNSQLINLFGNSTVVSYTVPNGMIFRGRAAAASNQQNAGYIRRGGRTYYVNNSGTTNRHVSALFPYMSSNNDYGSIGANSSLQFEDINSTYKASVGIEAASGENIQARGFNGYAGIMGVIEPLGKVVEGSYTVPEGTTLDGGSDRLIELYVI